jgi:16S rRNA (cytosine967-C5)-methyltransferase
MLLMLQQVVPWWSTPALCSPDVHPACCRLYAARQRTATHVLNSMVAKLAQADVVVATAATQVVADVLAGVDAEKALKRALRQWRSGLDEHSRGLVAQQALSAVASLDRLSHILRSTESTSALATDPAALLALHALTQNSSSVAGLPCAVQYVSKANVALLQDAIEQVQWPTDRAAALAVQHSLPVWLINRWLHELGAERTAALAASCGSKGPVSIRTNSLKTTAAQLQEQLATQHDIVAHAAASYIAPHGLVLRDGRPKGGVWWIKAYQNGLFEVQDLGSQHIVEACAATAGDRVLDYCAGIPSAAM